MKDLGLARQLKFGLRRLLQTWRRRAASLSAIQIILITLFLLGFGLTIKGGYMQAKAHFAQFLIEQAWEKTLVDSQHHKPWSWADTYPIAKLSMAIEAEEGSENKPPSEVSQRTHQREEPLTKRINLYVLAGASGRNLAFGPALVLSGAQPGELGNTIIAGHRDTHFSVLQYVKKDQVFHLTDISGTRAAYKVESSRVVHQSQLDVMEQTQAQELTLITCYPFNQLSGGAQLRYVVKAVPIAERIK